jgi:hypothetical protein
MHLLVLSYSNWAKRNFSFTHIHFEDKFFKKSLKHTLWNMILAKNHFCEK